MFSLDSLRVDTFDWKTSLSLAVASNISYASAAAVKNTAINQWRFEAADFLDVSDTQGFIARAPGVVLVAFRGTESVADWVGNLKLIKTDYENFGQVHYGFLECYKSVRAAVKDAARQAAGSGAKLWITGHSLGGALATLAAADVYKTCKVAGVYTFGQPRLGNTAFQNYIANNLGSRFYRFVNDDDIVPQLPPGFNHVGQLVHFDGDGQPRNADSASEAEAVEPPPLTEAEFKALQRQIQAIESTAEALSMSDTALDATVEGLFPSFSDHRIEHYIAIIRRLAFGATTDSQLQASEAEAVFKGYATTRGIADSLGERFPVLLQLATNAWSPPSGIAINSIVGTIATAQVFPAELEQLKQDPFVLAIEPSRPFDWDDDATLFLSEDVALGADQGTSSPVSRGNIEERGDAALIGIIDSGVDILHSCFRDANGKSRILAYWDQQEAQDVRSPASVASQSFTQNYGRLYLKDEIEAFIEAGEAPFSLRDSVERHGTHVASIAGGRAVGSVADGIAPEARFIVVAPQMKTKPGDPPSLGYSNSHVDALAFLKAAAAGNWPSAEKPILKSPMPMAINISLGMNAGAHDGSSTLEAAFDTITGMGRLPGLVIVKSAGNERNHAGHARIRAFPGIETIEWQSLPPPMPHLAPRKRDYFEVWYSHLDELEFTLVDPANNETAVVSAANPEVSTFLGSNICELRLARDHPDNGGQRLTISIAESGATPIQLGVWKLRVHGNQVLSGDGHVDIWVERNGKRGVRFTSHEPRMTLSIPGTARTVITVGACTSEPKPRMIDASSYGRTRDGRPKPDLCAPGYRVVAAAAGGGMDASVEMSGTSMAAPHVTGAIALLLSQRAKKTGQSQLNARQVQAILVRSVNASSGLHHEGFGYGRLDLAKLFLDVPIA